MKIFIIRHGEAAKSWDQSPDPSLSDLGREQAIECFKNLNSKEDLQEFNLISSPLSRAQETANPFKENLEKKVQIKEAFKEIPSPGISLLERKDWLQDIFKKELNELEKPQQIWQSEIISSIKELKNPSIIFSHFMVINIVASTLSKNKKIVSFYPDNCSIMELRKDKGELELISLGDELQTHVN
jgi:broad specificity phosphatase PhoE